MQLQAEKLMSKHLLNGRWYQIIFTNNVDPTTIWRQRIIHIGELITYIRTEVQLSNQ